MAGPLQRPSLEHALAAGSRQRVTLTVEVLISVARRLPGAAASFSDAARPAPSFEATARPVARLPPAAVRHPRPYRDRPEGRHRRLSPSPKPQYTDFSKDVLGAMFATASTRP